MEIRPKFIGKSIDDALKVSPIVFLNGARQAGKTTLVRSLDHAGSKSAFPLRYISLDSATQLAATNAPEAFLTASNEHLIIDETFRYLVLILQFYFVNKRKTIPKTTKKEYPYLNLSLDDIKGEQWDDIPGLDGYFLISNFGRIKRQPYEMQYRNGAIYLKPEKIIKPHIQQAPNNFKKDVSNFLTARVTLSGRRHSIMPGRLVYHCFVKAFDPDDKNLVVICRDTDNFNIQPANLRLATKKEKQQRTVERKRFRSPFLDMTEQQRVIQRGALIEKISQEISQYSRTGKRLKIFSSAAAAERATGIFATSIRKVAANAKFSAGGFIWRFGRASRVDVKAVKQERRQAYIQRYGQKVTQYDLYGKMLAHYGCIKDAAEASGVHVNAINMLLKGEYKSTKGFFWKKGHGKGDIDLSNHAWGRASTSLTQSKLVKQYHSDGRYIQSFDSVKLAAKTIGVSPATLVGALKGRQQTSAGFKWRYG